MKVLKIATAFLVVSCFSVVSTEVFADFKEDVKTGIKGGIDEIKAGAAAVNADINGKIGQLAMSLAKNKENAKYLCQKANILRGIITFRSFNGWLCANSGLAAAAIKVCGRTDGFDQSHCYERAKKALGGNFSPAFLKATIEGYKIRGSAEVKSVLNSLGF